MSSLTILPDSLTFIQFANAPSFNGDVSSFDVSNVQSFRMMCKFAFASCRLKCFCSSDDDMADERASISLIA